MHANQLILSKKDSAMKVAVVIMSDTDSAEGIGRVVQGLHAVKEFKEAGDEVQLIFDGAGAKVIGVVSQADHPYYRMFEAVKDNISGVCQYCAGAYHVTDYVTAARIRLCNDHQGHASYRKLLQNGYQVLSF